MKQPTTVDFSSNDKVLMRAFFTQCADAGHAVGNAEQLNKTLADDKGPYQVVFTYDAFDIEQSTKAEFFRGHARGVGITISTVKPANPITN